MFQIDISKRVQKARKTFCAGWQLYKLPFPSVFVRQRAKNCPNMTKISRRGQDTHYISVYQRWGLYIIFEAMNTEKLLWHILGCKVGQCPDWNETRTWCVTPPSKCIYKASCRYFKTYRKIAWKTSKSQKRPKLIASITEIIFAKKRNLCREAGHLWTKFEGFILIYEAMIAKNEFDILLAVNYIKVTQLC